jgi:hypothetical protein
MRLEDVCKHIPSDIQKIIQKNHDASEVFWDIVNSTKMLF